MPFFIITIFVILAVIWWLSSQRRLSFNERQYLKQRGYETSEEAATGQPVSKDARLFSLIESLADLSPYARQKAAEDLARMCDAGRRDLRMLSALVAALDDSDASVRSAAANALASLGSDRAIEPLKRRIGVEESIHARAAMQRAVEKLAARSAG
jgi:HEAT repeats